MVLYIIYNNIIWACILAALIGAGAATLVFVLRGKKGSGEEKEFSSKNAFVNGIRDNNEQFAGIYEAMYSVARGKTAKKREAFDKWAQAVADTGNEEMLKEFNKKCGKYTKWKPRKTKKFVKAAKKLVKSFFKAGVIRSHDLYVIADETTAEKYHLAGDGMITTDEEYEVLSPYWAFDGTVLEKGVIR